MAVGTQRCYWFGKTRLKLEHGFYVATTLKRYVGDQQLKFWCIQNVGSLQKHENLAFCWVLTSFSAAARASGASRRPPQQTRTVLYSRDTVRVYIRYAYLYAVFSNPGSMSDGKVKYKGTVLKVRPWIFSYGVEQIWDQLEKYANLERQKSQDAQGFGGKVNAIGEKGCSVCIALGKEGRGATHTTADHRWTPSDLKTIQSKMDGKGNSPKNLQQDGARDADQHGRGRVKGSPKERTKTGHQKITRSKAENQVAQDGPMLVKNLVENLVKKVEKAKESPGIKMIAR